MSACENILRMGAGRCASCGAPVPLPGEEQIKPLSQEISIERRLRTSVAIDLSDDEEPLTPSRVRILLSWIVDTGFLAALSLLVSAAAIPDLFSARAFTLLPSLLGLFALTTFVYLALFAAMGGTLGDRAVGVQTLSEKTLLPPSLPCASLRALTAVVGSFAFLAGPLWALFDDRAQSLHDKISGTFYSPVPRSPPA